MIDPVCSADQREAIYRLTHEEGKSAPEAVALAAEGVYEPRAFLHAGPLRACARANRLQPRRRRLRRTEAFAAGYPGSGRAQREAELGYGPERAGVGTLPIHDPVHAAAAARDLLLQVALRPSERRAVARGALEVNLASGLELRAVRGGRDRIASSAEGAA